MRALAAVALLGALALPTSASAEMLDPTGETVIVYVESSPKGAAIEFKGFKQKYKTNNYVSFEKDFIRTIRVILDGYEPCSATQDELPRDPDTGDLILICELVRVDTRTTEVVNWLPWYGPIGPLLEPREEQLPVAAGPIASDGS